MDNLDQIVALLEEIRSLHKKQLQVIQSSTMDAQEDRKRSIELQQTVIARSQSNWRLYRIVVTVALVILVILLGVAYKFLISSPL